MDAISLLRKDHRTVEALFKEFERAEGKAKQRKKIVAQIIRELSIHAAIEETVFYPAVRAAAKASDGRTAEKADDTVLESLEEHHIVKWTLSELDGLDPEAERFEAKVTVLMESVRHHVKEEQDELFPAVKKMMEPVQLRDLGKLLEKAKKVAPTRPHPRSPGQPPGNIVAGGVAAVADRARDAVAGVVSKVRSKGKALQRQLDA